MLSYHAGSSIAGFACHSIIRDCTMTYIGRYKILETIHQTRSSIVYRGQRDGDTHTAIIKFMRAKFPSSYEISRFKKEYDIIKSLDMAGVVKTHELIDYDTGIALVLEDFDAISLRDVLQKKPMALDLFLTMAMQITEILGMLHKNNVVHRDIKPDNILVSRDHQHIKLTDFGIAQLVTRENEEIYDPAVIEGTLRYMSPEQTRRMNRAVDYRTDLYSLGITFYEMLTGRVPFDFNDPLELIHAHIAREATPPDEINADIPGIISDMIHKLLIKPAEERYQNAMGLLYDLRQAQAQWQETGTIQPFELATRDFAHKFNIPQQIIGREDEMKTILQSFDRAAGQGIPEMLFVSGTPGVGKSFLVEELYKPILAKRGYFVSGKYDQFRKDVPYSAIIHAFIKLIHQLLVESDDRLTEWKTHILEALGDNAKVITDIIPPLKTIIGEPAEVAELGAEEAEHRFHHVFKNFLKVFTTFDHPLVLILDDLQWADLASLKLIQHVFAMPDNGHFLFIGIYRDNEVSEAHALTPVMDAIQTSALGMETISIQPLGLDSVRRLLGKFLRLDIEKVATLADIVFDKTRGNPFFINQFAKRLYETGMLTVDETGKWQWDEKAIRNLQITDNVVDLMVQKINDISPDAREVLRVASCIGNRFELETMCIVTGRTPDLILTEMKDALETGLVYFDQTMCHFLHDRIQEAAYSLIADEEKEVLHYVIGRYIYRNTPDRLLMDKIFYIVNHLNTGRSQITSSDEQIDIVRLNLLAGKKAKASAAYDSALAYFSAGIDLLHEPDWKTHYEILYDIHLLAAEAAYLNADFSAMAAYLDQALAHHASLLDKSKAYEIKIQAFMAQNRLVDAVDATREILNTLNFSMPAKIHKRRMVLEIIQTKLVLINKPPEKIVHLPDMEDPYALAINRIFTIAAPAFHLGGFTMEVAFLVLKMVRLSMRKGIALQTPYWFACYSMVLFMFSPLDVIFRYTDLALALRKRLGVKEIRSSLIIHAYIQPWRTPLADVLPVLMDVYNSGFEVGDVSFSLYVSAYYCEHLYNSGKELTHVEKEIDKIKKVTRQFKMETMLNYNNIVHQVTHNLQGNAGDPTVLQGEHYNRSVMIQQHRDANDSFALASIHFYTAQLNFIFGNYDIAFEEIRKGKEHLIAVSGGLYHFALFYFYQALIRLARLDENSPAGTKKSILKKTGYYNSKLQYWAKYAPLNFQHKYDLVEAERARVKGDVAAAQALYEKAAKGAKASRYLQETAIANERAANFYHQRGFKAIADLYLSRALTAYAKWGATAKVEHLKASHPRLNDPAEWEQMTDTVNSDSTSALSGSTMVDLQTVFKAAGAISGEIVLEKVVAQLLNIGIENAGAQKGALLFEKNGRLFVEAISDVTGHIAVPGAMPVNEYPDIPRSVVNYVLKTNEDLVLDHASEDDRFARDPYIETRKIKSILCMPLEQKGKTVAIVYLENNLTTRAFTPDRLAVLRVISSQAAIAIENARLFEVARRDGLTELINHRYFQYSLQKELETATVNGHKVSLLMLDIDHFKNFNDTYGHQAGDLVLKHVAGLLQENAPDKDLVGRYGGEEFAIILPGMQEETAKSLAEDIRRAVETEVVNYNAHALQVTVSIGMSTFPYHGNQSDKLIKSADKALYKSKELGRNRVTVS